MALTADQEKLKPMYRLYLNKVVPGETPNQTVAQWEAKSAADQEADLKNWTNDFAEAYVNDNITACGSDPDLAPIKTQLEIWDAIIASALTSWGL